MKTPLFLLLLAAVSLPNAHAGLAAYWTFDGNGNDTSSSGLHGSLVGDATYSPVGGTVPTALAGGQSLTLDGSGAWFSVNPGANSLSGRYAVSTWVRVADIATRSFYSSRQPGEFGFDAKLQGGTLIHGDIGNGSVFLTTTADAPLAYTPGDWQHIVYNVTPNGHEIFANGVRVANNSHAFGNPLLFDATRQIQIGAYAGGVENFNGQIDNVSIFNQNLTAAQISQLSSGTLAPTAVSQNLVNGSFEENTFATGPGYIGSGTNGPITGWTASRNDRIGINTQSGPFAPNVTVPNGTNAAFIQSTGNELNSLGTTLEGLTPGQTYRVTFETNARAGHGAAQSNFTAGGSSVDFRSNSLGTYRTVSLVFTATGTTAPLLISNQTAGDTALVIDNVQMAIAKTNWKSTAWTNDASTGLDAAFGLGTRIFSFGSTTSGTLNSIPVTGIGGGNPTVVAAGPMPGFSTAGFGSVFNNDANNVFGVGSSVIDNDFVYGGPNQSVTLTGLTPGQDYVLRLLGVGFDDAPYARSATFGAGTDLLTINENAFGNNNGNMISYTFTATGASQLFSINQTGEPSFHLYGLAVTVVPEPSRAAFLFFALAGLVIRRTRK
jgi:hypothetical protein